MSENTSKELEVFAELGQLCVSPGYIHVIAYLIIRDNLVQYKIGEPLAVGKQLNDGEKLIRTEVNLLIGLMLKQEIDFTIPPPDVLHQRVKETEKLLHELHHAISAQGYENWTPEMMRDGNFNPMAQGKTLREAIFYGGEPAFNFQYRDFLIPKFAADNDWLRANMGFSIEECRAVILASNEAMNQNTMNLFANGKSMRPEDISYLPCNQFTANQVAEHSKLPPDVVTNVLSAFTMASDERNQTYNATQDDNVIAKTPLIKIENNYTLFNPYNLTESAYQAPFFWMRADKKYIDTAMKNRGAFTESFATQRLSAVFGKNNVHTGINVWRGKELIGEIDVLVIFSDRLVTVQAKSKQLTMAARRGSDTHLQVDFQGAVQDACDQNSECAKAILAKDVVLKDGLGNIISLPEDVLKIYPICVISDNYPALSMQVSQFLKFPSQDFVASPFVVDVFFLDVMAEMLDSPLHFLNFLDRRAFYFGRISAAFELTTLAFHLSQNLFIEDATSMVMLGDDIAEPLNAAMAARRDGVPGLRTPPGLLTRLEGTTLGKVVQQINKEPNSALISFGLLILSMAEETNRKLSNALSSIAAQTRRDKRSHSITVQVENGGEGFTALCTFEKRDDAVKKLLSHSMLRKYKQKADGWYGILLNPLTETIDFAGYMDDKWEKDDALDVLSQAIRVADEETRKEAEQRMQPQKVGRNEACPCGSEMKFKRCCGS